MNIDIINYVNVLPWHTKRKWGKRSLSSINKVIIHQSLSTGSLEGVNNYHITPGTGNHISPYGAPHICYHFAINKEGEIYKCNPLSSVVWHCRKQNTFSIGVLILGHFSGPSHIGKEDPSERQLESLKDLLDGIIDKNNAIAGNKTSEIFLSKNDIFGHNSFGKENCPGNLVSEFIETYK